MFYIVYDFCPFVYADDMMLLEKIKEWRHVITATLAMILCLGIMDQIVFLIDKFLMPILGHEANLWLGIFSMVLNIILVIWGWKVCIYQKRHISEEGFAWILFGEFVYWYFRFSPYYDFNTYGSTLIAYFDPIAVFVIFAAVCIIIHQCKRDSLKKVEKISTVSFHRDDAIHSLEEDVFGLEGFVNRIITYLDNTDLSCDAFSIGLVGQWGEGKSSLMNLIKSKLSEDDFLIIDFNPRNSKDTAHIQSDFLVKLRLTLSPLISGMGGNIIRYAESINIVDDTPGFLAWLIKVFAVHKNKDSEALRQNIEKAIAKTGKKIVVFVDDLDRLTGEELIEVMKLLARNGAFRNIFFLTAYDKLYVNKMISDYFGGNVDINYTDKYFNTEIPIPLHSPHKVRNYLEKLLLEEKEQGNITVANDQITFVIAYSAEKVSRRIKTIRDVKRFVNQFMLAFTPVEDEVSFRDFFLLELLHFAHPDEYIALHQKNYIHRGSVISRTAVSSDLWYLNNELTTSETNTSLKDKSSLPLSIDLLQELFPTEASYQSWYPVRQKRVFSISSFEYYFYRYEYAHLTSKETNELLKMDLPQSFDELVRLNSLYPKDVETALVTLDITDFNDGIALKRYFHIIVSALIMKNTSLNYIPSAFLFLRKENIEHLITTLNLNDKSKYADWIENALTELLNKSPKATSNFINHAIGVYHEGSPVEDLYCFSEDEMLDIAAKIFKTYLNKINEESWDVNQALQMSMILDDQAHIYTIVANELKQSISLHFNKYSNGLLIVDKSGGAKATFHPFFFIDDVFPNKDEFEQLLFSKDNDNANGICEFRAFWNIFKENDYKGFSLTTIRGEDDTSEYDFKKETTELNQYYQYKKKLDVLVEKWDNNKRLSECDKMIEELESLQLDIQVNPLQIALEKKYEDQITGIVKTISYFKQHAADITDDIQNGDFVKFKDNSPRMQIYKWDGIINAFTFQERVTDISCKLKESTNSYHIDELQAIPIDGQSDSMIYYDPPVSASVVKQGQPIPTHKTDYSYYMDSFQNYSIGDKTYKQIVEEEGFQFVHEVQHWLKDNFQSSDLKIKETDYSPLIIGG